MEFLGLTKYSQVVMKKLNEINCIFLDSSCPVLMATVGCRLHTVDVMYF